MSLTHSFNRSFGLDLVRAFAIFFVLLSHFAQGFEILGFIGVEMFFALSGFLIGKILWRTLSGDTLTIASLLNFFKRRWYRTIPNYFLFFTVSLFFHHFITKNLPDFNTIKNYLLFSQYLMSPSHGFYGVSWSLCVEEWFYLLFPISLYILRKLGVQSLKSFFFSVLFFYIFSFLIRGYLLDNEIYNLRKITFARLDSIVSGVFVALLVIHKGATKNIPNVCLLIGIFLLLSCFTLISNDFNVSSNPLSLTLVPLSFALMLPRLELIKQPNNEIISDCVTKISLWSYSIYLSHIPVLFTLYYLLEDYSSFVIVKLLIKLSGLVLTIFLSRAVFIYFETPFTKKRPKEITAS